MYMYICIYIYILIYIYIYVYHNYSSPLTPASTETRAASYLRVTPAIGGGWLGVSTNKQPRVLVFCKTINRSHAHRTHRQRKHPRHRHTHAHDKTPERTPPTST